MAAKVALVAVPTVLGIASIRVYTVSEASTDGLVTREKLNIYTPLPQSAPAQFVPEEPGLIQSGFTTTREGILPVAQAVKGAYVSVKTGTINLYHAGEDVYYYLKDPPPGFLPRFGTITMAGLLGMFLARKGSRFKRVAVPMGLMSAGASVCYPAQAVAVLKVTSKKVYAAGQWSGAAVSSLFTSKPKEPVAKEVAASQPEAAPVPNPESAVVTEPPESNPVLSSSIPEKEAVSAEPVPISEDPIVAVVTDKESSVTLPEISPDQTSTEANTDPVVHSVPVETETTITSEEMPAPVESEPAGTKQVAEDASTDVSSAEPTPSLESAPVEAASVEASPVESAPVEAASVEASPVESDPVEATPVESAPVEATPVESAPVEAAPVESAPVEAAPVESAPVEAAPVESAPVEAAPVEAAPVESAPVEAAPVESAPVESAQVEAAVVEPSPVESAPSQPDTVEAVPIDSVPTSEELPAPEAADAPLVPAVEPSDPTAAAEDTPTASSPLQPTVENNQGTEPILRSLHCAALFVGHDCPERTLTNTHICPIHHQKIETSGFDVFRQA
ncbi:MICOS complex subunit MIC27 isoform X7 [Xyrichtys novacula]|uniref:MICOS complex subunit n=1 Tax=Xyrichtys novacula TaxID=13765 RepID=A0AAV1FC45_XYRNO|nr:MICOS complex subunit MIC27 isoform X7 [Xyrichtys novacula]